jgi:hypothetical protein
VGRLIAVEFMTLDGVMEASATRTDLVFRSSGSVSLRGVPGLWELFSASLGDRDAAR